MTRLFTSGAETGTNEWNGAYTSGFSNVAASSSVKRTGLYSWRFFSYGTGNSSYFRQVFAASITEIYGRVSIYVASDAATRDIKLVDFRDSNNAVQCWIEYDPGASVLEWRNGAGLLAAGNITVPIDAWIVVEYHVAIGSSGSLTLKINGTTDATFSGDTDYTNIGNLRSVYFSNVLLSGGLTGNATVYMDDIAINDTSGTYQNSWIGLGGVFYLEPTADGITIDWTPSAGTVNYANVDDIPPDNATTYNQAVTTGERDLYVIDDCPEYINTINLVQVVYRAAVAESGYNLLQDVIYLAGTAYAGLTSTVVPITPSYTYYLGTTHYINPNTAAAWGTAEVNDMQAGMEIA